MSQPPDFTLPRGAYAPPRVLAGALAGQCERPLIPVFAGALRNGFGGGAEADTRGRVRSPDASRSPRQTNSSHD